MVYLEIRGKGGSSRRSSSNGEQDPRQEELGVDIAGLDKQEQGQANDSITNHGDKTNTQAVRDEAPEGAGDQRHDLIDKAESSDNVADSIVDSNKIYNNEGNAAV